MALRDLIAADVAAILTDSDEFGGLVNVDGVEVPGVLDEDTTGAAPRTSAGRNAEGVYQSEAVLYTRLADPGPPAVSGLPARPVCGQRMVVKGKRWSVAHVGESMGLLAVRLTWWEG